MTIATLEDQFIADLQTLITSIAGSDLGTYTIDQSDGTTTTEPAIAVERGLSDEFRQGVTKLEFIIELPEDRNLTPYLSHVVDAQTTLRVVCVQWDNSVDAWATMDKFMLAVNSIDNRTAALNQVRVSQSPTIGNLKQASCTVTRLNSIVAA